MIEKEVITIWENWKYPDGVYKCAGTMKNTCKRAMADVIEFVIF